MALASSRRKRHSNSDSLEEALSLVGKSLSPHYQRSEDKLRSALSEENRRWLEQFAHKYGRPPRILHIGNIANNAYLNSKLLHKIGVDSDVICHDYYHIMAWPEWEDAVLEGNIEDHFYPAVNPEIYGSFSRPDWFVQGPFHSCVAYLAAKQNGDAASKKNAWSRLLSQLRLTCFFGRLSNRLTENGRRIRTARALAVGKRGFRGLVYLLKHLKNPLSVTKSATRKRATKPQTPGKNLLKSFLESFPDISSVLSVPDRREYCLLLSLWKPIFDYYDLVVGYSTDGVYPLMCGKSPYIAYEHGTIRHIPFQDTTQGRLCALTYREADKAFITNGDNDKAARKLGLKRWCFVPHPVNEDLAEPDGEDPQKLRSRLCESLKCDFLVFHPPRQHWGPERDPSWEKGNDIFIRGFARFIKEVCPSAGAIFVEWGLRLQESKQLLSELGISNRVIWVDVMPNMKMITYLCASDLMVDQFYLGAFGSTLPKAFLHGCPSMMYVSEEMHAWCFPEMPPVINARTPDEVYKGLTRLHRDPDLKRRLSEDGRAWYDRYHSNAVIAEQFMTAFRETISLEPLEEARNDVGSAV